jgi:hypothetical protein
MLAFASDQFLYNYNFGTLVRKEQTKVFQRCLTTNHYYQKPNHIFSKNYGEVISG